MEPHEVLPDWLERMALLATDALGYEVYTLDGEHLGRVVEVVRPPVALRAEQLVIARGRWSKTSEVSVSLIRAVDSARRLVILALGAAAIRELGQPAPSTADAAEAVLADETASSTSSVALPTYLLFIPTLGGYSIAVEAGSVPDVDVVVFVGGRSYVVSKVGRSPLPGDRRRCAYLL